jgi:multisubunit Na+/H+ antiporter MnhE subunit
VIGAVCCIGPAVGVAMGAGAGSFLLAMGSYRFVTFILGALFAFVLTYAIGRFAVPRAIEALS